MNKAKRFTFLLLFLLPFIASKANDSKREKADDLLTLGQAYINLSLTEKYFDTLKYQRIQKILTFEENELASIKDSGFIKSNECMYNITYSLLYFGKARILFSNKKDVSRKALLQWKSTLDSAIAYFNKSEKEKNKYYISYVSDYEFFGFNLEIFDHLYDRIQRLKDQFTPYFNKDIYPDFKRIFFQEKATLQFQFDSLLNYTSLYNMPLSRYVLELTSDSAYEIAYPKHEAWKINGSYRLDIALDLISRYLQLKFVAVNFDSLCKVDKILDAFHYFVNQLNPEDAINFNPSYEYNSMQKDDFFRNNLDSSACKKLYGMLKKITKPANCPVEPDETHNVGSGHDNFPDRKYFFPDPAPFPSAYKYIFNYKPGLNKMKEVDKHLKGILSVARIQIIFNIII